MLTLHKMFIAIFQTNFLKTHGIAAAYFYIFSSRLFGYVNSLTLVHHLSNNFREISR